MLDAQRIADEPRIRADNTLRLQTSMNFFHKRSVPMATTKYVRSFARKTW